MKTQILAAALVFVSAPLAAPLNAQEERPAAAERESALAKARKEIGAAVKTYVAAFNDGDVAKLTKLWTPNCVYSVQGNRVAGREAVTAQFKEALADKASAPKLAVETTSIEFISPSVALERGVAVVTRGDGAEQTSYTAVYVKEDGRWLIDRVSEEEIQVPQSNYERLAALEWMIGDWVDAGDGYSIAMQCDWTANQNFISRKFQVTTSDSESTGLQIIGWDAKEKRIRSWLFDSNGGFVSGIWTPRDKRWVVQSVANLPDGSSGSFTSVFTPRDDGNYAWKKINRVLDGKLLPNVPEVTVRRK